jgi:hypothetical protein
MAWGSPHSRYGCSGLIGSTEFTERKRLGLGAFHLKNSQVYPQVIEGVHRREVSTTLSPSKLEQTWSKQGISARQA